MFEWHWVDIARECEQYLALKGFGGDGYKKLVFKLCKHAEFMYICKNLTFLISNLSHFKKSFFSLLKIDYFFTHYFLTTVVIPELLPGFSYLPSHWDLIFFCLTLEKNKLAPLGSGGRRIPTYCLGPHSLGK